MADTPSTASSVTTVTVAALSGQQAGQVVEWVFSVLKVSIPDSVALIIGAALIPVFHALYTRVLARLGAPTPGATP